jgi:L-ascorbate metabolism protein UlaG (beta-lactamase superfamily)
MVVTFLQHASFLVECEKVALLFDYFDGEVTLPENKDLIVFASHRHGDHYNKRIFDLPARAFVLSDDIPAEDIPHGIVVHRMGSHQRIEVEGLVARTLQSTDEGVAFLLEVEGKVIYFAGDLNNWFWEEEGEAYTSWMEREYHKELDRLPSAIDVAFVPVDPRLGKRYGLGARDLLERVSVSYLVPMHMWGEFAVGAALKEAVSSYDVEVLTAQRNGQRWRIA